METVVLLGFETFEQYALNALCEGRSALVVNGERGDADWFAGSVAEAKAGLFDFDGTLHAGSQWGDIRTLMTPERSAANRAEADRYFRRENGEPSAEENTRFLYNSVRRMEASGVLADSIRDLARASPPRPGAVELLRSFEREHFRTSLPHYGIVSFGVYDYILAWCSAQRLLTPIIAATHLRISPLHMSDGKIHHPAVYGADPLTFVGTHTKGHAAHAIVESFGVPMNRVLVVGDTPTDMHMMSGGNVGVLLLPHSDGDPSRAAFRLRGLEEMWPRVAAVLISDSLEYLAELRRQ